MTRPVSVGLDGVVAADTMLSDVDGQRGRLVVRGHGLSGLLARHDFEGVVALLFKDLLPAPASPQTWAGALGAAREAVFTQGQAGGAHDLALPPIDAIRALIARQSDGDDLDTALRLVAAPAVFTAAWLRRSRGQEPVAPDASLGHAADTLRMAGLTGGPAEARTLDAYLVTVADHGLNASTFASRVVASTQAGLTSSVLAAISALKGPLHGGAPGPVLDMLDAIGPAERAEAWITAALDRGERLMGFGHRIYRVRDPRADALKHALATLTAASPDARTHLERAQAIETIARRLLKAHRPDRALDTNVEFYTALLLDALGFPRETFTCVFAMGRVAGWIAHAREQVLTGRLIRPQSRYVGPEAGGTITA